MHFRESKVLYGDQISLKIVIPKGTIANNPAVV